MQNKKFQRGICVIFSLLLLFTAILGVYDFAIPSQISKFDGESMPEYFLTSLSQIENAGAKEVSAFSVGSNENARDTSELTLSNGVKTEKVQAKLLGIIPVKNIDINVYKNITLYPGGIPFGVKFFTEGVLIVGFSDVTTKNGKENPAYNAGLRVRDIITKINDQSINGLENIIKTIENGNEIKITYIRNNEEHSTTLTPVLSLEENKYKTGMWIRDSGAGIGTVTFINPQNNSFAGLGHGICDIDTGELMPISRGSVMDVTINGVTKGVVGTPGELKGYFGNNKIGSLIGNTDYGVYGLLSEIPQNLPEKALPIALRDEIKEGPAYIWCTLSDNVTKKYAIEISEINRKSLGPKSFSVKITDPDLLSESGGIVQGMSGSPIIQNGKLIGAVTHVLVNDPTSGYGIFIENMLCGMPDILK